MEKIRSFAIIFLLLCAIAVVPVQAGEDEAGAPLSPESSGDSTGSEPAAPGDDPPTGGDDPADDETKAEGEGDDEQAQPLSLTTSSFSSPTLGSRKLGQSVVDDLGKKKVWPHKLPVWGQKILDLGVDFPDPYGVSIIGTYLSQELKISDLAVSFDDGQTYQPFDWVEFPGSGNSTYSVETKIDAWLFPFMNVFAVVGYVKGNGNVPVGLPIEPLLDTLGHGHLCPDSGPLRPQFCDDVIMLDALPEYYGYNAGIGTVLAMGWKGFFVTFPISYVYSDMSNLEYTVTALTVETLLGHTFKMGNGMLMEIFIGGSYLNTTNSITNVFNLPLSEIDGTLLDVDIQYQIDETNTDKWNYVVGGQFQFSKAWALQALVGFGGTREQYTLAVTYRW